jgi:hypothetical protein
MTDAVNLFRILPQGPDVLLLRQRPHKGRDCGDGHDHG